MFIALWRNGQITGITDNVDNGRSLTHSYDALYRITSAVTNGSAGYVQWGLSFDYDRYGNRLHQTATFDGPPTNSLSVNAATNRISTSGYAYDANGNMTQDGPSANTLVYDAENRVLSATNGGSSGTYSHDGHGLRVKKVSGSITTVYVFSGTKVIAEYVNGAAPASPTREYIYAGALLLAKIEGGVTNYYHSDHLSSRVTTDSSGNVAGQQGHYPFGDSWYTQNSTTKFQFTSYERDAESGNDYAMARVNITRLGRFSSPDPIAGSLGDPQSLNRYTYVLNNPIGLVDPMGLEPQGGPKNSHVVPFLQAQWERPGQCVIDGIEAPCSLAYAMLESGAAAQCPYNNCTGVVIRDDSFYRYMWVATATIKPPSDCDLTHPFIDRLTCQGALTMDTQQGWVFVAVGTTGAGSSLPFDSNFYQERAQDAFTLVAGSYLIAHPAENVALNGMIFVVSGTMFVASDLLIVGGCGELTPFEPITCAASIGGGVVTTGVAVSMGALGAWFFKNFTVPSFKESWRDLTGGAEVPHR